MDDDGEIDREIRVLNEIAEQYAGSRVVIEATSNYYTIYNTLNEYLDVVVANPQQTKTIGIAEVKMIGLTRSCYAEPLAEVTALRQ